MKKTALTTTRRPTCVGLFAGIGGFELGFARAGFDCVHLCENDPHATAVLRRQFPRVPIHPDITTLKTLPNVDAVMAGFPCQDLSQVGRRQGIDGPNSKLVEHVFRIVGGMRKGPTWLVLENVPFMLRLAGGKAMDRIVTKLEQAGLNWAYRVFDSRAFGLPQRRRRLIILASKTHDPRPILFGGDEELPQPPRTKNTARGFYWTEGNTGIGWTIDGIPTLKGGSRLSIPSPPAIWIPESGFVGIPEIRDAERLQGFPAGWTVPAKEVDDRGGRSRWRLIGNAVSVPLSHWLAKKLRRETISEVWSETELGKKDLWPLCAACGGNGRRFSVKIGPAPIKNPAEPLADFIRFPMRPLSARAAGGFLGRAQKSNLNFEPGFLAAIKAHVKYAEKLTANKRPT